MNFQQLTQLVLEADQLQGQPYPTGSRKYVDNDAYNRQSQLAKRYQDSGILKKLGHKLFNTQANRANKAIKNVNKADINALNAQSRMSDVDTGYAEQEHAETSKNRTDMNIGRSRDEIKKYQAGQNQRDYDTQAKTKKIGDFFYALGPTGNPYKKWDGKDWVDLSDADMQYFAKVGGKSAEEHQAEAQTNAAKANTAQQQLQATTQQLQKQIQDLQAASAKSTGEQKAQYDAKIAELTTQLQDAQTKSQAAEGKLKGYEDTAAKQARAQSIENAAIQIHAKNTGKSPQDAAADWANVNDKDKEAIRNQAAKTVK